MVKCNRMHVLLLLLGISSWGYLPAQMRNEFRFQNISVRHGLSQSSPNCIIQDRAGFLWIGTDDGLNRYDGYSFKVFRPDPDNLSSLSSARVSCLAEDNDGNIWIGTKGTGLDCYMPCHDKFIRFGMPDSNYVYGGYITAMTWHKNALWIGTQTGLFIVGKEKIISPFRHNNLLTSENITCLFAAGSTLWVGTDGGLNTVDLNNFSVFNFPSDVSDKNALSSDYVAAVIQDREKNIWVATDSQLHLYIKGQKHFERMGSQVEGKISAMAEDARGNIWLANLENGIDVYALESGTLQAIRHSISNPDGLHNNEVLSLFRDRTGIIWAGTNGLDKSLLGHKFTLYNYYITDGIIKNFRHIHALYADRDDRLWVGSKTDGVILVDRRKNKSIGLNNIVLPSNKIRVICEHPEGVLWIGTEDAGLFKVRLDEDRNPADLQHYSGNQLIYNSLTSNTIYSILPLPSGELWLGTAYGISILNPATDDIKRKLPDESVSGSLNNETAYYLCADRLGQIWVATDNGVNLYRPKSESFSYYLHDPNNPQSLSGSEILTIMEDSKGIIWIGTYGHGMNRLDPKTGVIDRLEYLSEMRSAVVYGILEDNQNSLWVSTNHGICRFSPATGQLQWFGVKDGLQSNDFNGGAYFKSHRGELFFGGQFGFNAFHPEKIMIDTVAPLIVITELKVNNQVVGFGPGSPIDRDISQCREIRLSHRQNNFSIVFAGIHFANPQENRYAYKLEGFDKDWIAAGSLRNVSYTRLPYRTFQLRIKAANSDGVWNKTELSVKVIVKPPFWLTWWARLLLIILAAFGVWAIIRYRNQREAKHMQRLEKEIEANRKELHDALRQLAEQREEIILQRQEIRLREKEQLDVTWFNEGISRFSDIISKNRNDRFSLLQSIIHKLVEYVEAEQGGVYLINDETPDEQFLELIASYAFPESRRGLTFLPGEGYIGTCFVSGNVIEVDRVPDGYTVVNSGLGSEAPKYLALIPIKIDDIIEGVIEVASFNKLKGFKVAFMLKMTETLASVLYSQKSAERNIRLLEQSRLQAEELVEHEEELRQNLEEMMATQEESNRREEELISQAEEFASREVVMQEEVEQLKAKVELLQNSLAGFEGSLKN